MIAQTRRPTSLTLVLLTGPWLATLIAAAPEPASNAVEVVVTAAPIPAEPSELGHRAEFLGAAELRTLPARSAAAGLDAATSVTVQERGAGNVQADLSIRGSTFQQVLLTLDGLALGDPQTAHHLMNLPMPMLAMDALTVLPGGGSALFGPAAFAGTVDVGLWRPTANRGLLRTSSGSFETRRIEGRLDQAATGFASTLAADWAQSDGFRDGTDYTTWSLFGSVFPGSDAHGARISAGHAEREFGARDFYAPYPSEEKTRTTLVDVAPHIEVADWELAGIARYRRNTDRFILTRENPGLYRNDHVTETITERLSARSPDRDGRGGVTAFGIERQDSRIESSNLGTHNQFSHAVFAEQRFATPAWTADLGLRLDDHSRWGTEFSPSVGGRVLAWDSLAFRASASRVIRPPSFTELYYRDPRNVGDPALHPETAWCAEAGLDWTPSPAARADLTGFVRDAEDLIDWVRSSTNNPWVARNIGSARTTGAEAGLSLGRGPASLRAEYRFTDLHADASGLQSKYALNVPRHDAALRVKGSLPGSVVASAQVRRRWVPTLDDYTLLGAGLARTWGGLTLFVNGANLLDADYQTIPGVASAGRSVEFGIEAEW
jgi:iron complex outermembrane receptor protein